MSNNSKNTERLSIDVSSEEHRRIKAFASSKGLSLRMFVIQCVRKQLPVAREGLILDAMSTHPNPTLKEIWDNDEDAIYDQL
ncbi:MAG: hypothetical protein ACI9CF_000719 [Candidatus Omnitrophota bacterium]|jgi:hypothetical protein